MAEREGVCSEYWTEAECYLVALQLGTRDRKVLFEAFSPLAVNRALLDIIVWGLRLFWYFVQLEVTDRSIGTLHAAPGPGYSALGFGRTDSGTQQRSRSRRPAAIWPGRS